jgi:hypothetical protein
MSVLDDFVRIALYRKRALEFELLAETEAFPRCTASFPNHRRHYRELMDRELQADKARMAELIERARLHVNRLRKKQACQRQVKLSPS